MEPHSHLLATMQRYNPAVVAYGATRIFPSGRVFGERGADASQDIRLLAHALSASVILTISLLYINYTINYLTYSLELFVCCEAQSLQLSTSSGLVHQIHHPPRNMNDQQEHIRSPDLHHLVGYQGRPFCQRRPIQHLKSQHPMRQQ